MKSFAMILAGLVLAIPGFASAQTVPPVAAASGPLRPLPSTGRWFVSPNAGFDVTIAGTFVTETLLNATQSTSVFGNAVAAGTNVRVNKQGFHDAFDTPFHLGFEIGYDFNPVNEAAVALRWLHAGSKTFNAMTLTGGTTYAGQTIGGGMNVKGKFNEYEEYGLDGVYRHYFANKGQFHPYMSGMAGLKYSPDLTLTLTAPGLEIASAPFYDAGWVWEVGTAIGFRWDITPGIAFGMEAQLRYASQLDRALSYSNTANTLAGFNRGGERFDAPITISFLARF